MVNHRIEKHRRSHREDRFRVQKDFRDANRIRNPAAANFGFVRTSGLGNIISSRTSRGTERRDVFRINRDYKRRTSIRIDRSVPKRRKSNSPGRIGSLQKQWEDSRHSDGGKDVTETRELRTGFRFQLNHRSNVDYNSDSYGSRLTDKNVRQLGEYVSELNNFTRFENGPINNRVNDEKLGHVSSVVSSGKQSIVCIEDERKEKQEFMEVFSINDLKLRLHFDDVEHFFISNTEKFTPTLSRKRDSTTITSRTLPGLEFVHDDQNGWIHGRHKFSISNKKPKFDIIEKRQQSPESSTSSSVDKTRKEENCDRGLGLTDREDLRTLQDEIDESDEATVLAAYLKREEEKRREFEDCASLFKAMSYEERDERYKESDRRLAPLVRRFFSTKEIDKNGYKCILRKLVKQIAVKIDVLSDKELDELVHIDIVLTKMRASQLNSNIH